MPDKENVVRNLERMLSNYDMLDDIVINKNNEMLMFHRAVAKAALELLKEQHELLCKKQKDIDKLQADYAELRHKFLEKTQIVRCKDCKHRHSLTGTCVNIDGACFQSYVGDDWFCADGDRK